MPEAWICQNCESWIDEPFTVCWNCGTTMDGEPDSQFGAEADVDKLTDAPEVPRIQCLKCGYRGKVLFTSRGKKLGDWLLSGIVSILVSQRSWIQLCSRVCPRCRSGDTNTKPWSGVASPADEATWREATDEESFRGKKNRRNVYLLLAAIVTAISVLYFAVSN